jgi:manganese/zinc/iron transport system permease protein
MPSLLDNPTFWYVAAGCALLGVVTGTLGCLTLLRRQSLLGDTLAHAALPGVCLAFLTATALAEAGWAVDPKSPGVLLTGAMAAALAGALWMLGIVRGTRLKEDAALGIVLSVFFGAGIVLLTLLQRRAGAGQAGLDRYLFGSAASIIPSDLAVFAGLGLAVLAVLGLFYKELKLLAFDPGFAESLGLPVRGLEVLLTVLAAAAVVIGLQAVGVVLMAALLITPAAAARQWTDRLSVMMLISAGVGAGSGVAGAVISSLGPKIPTGPVVVLAATAALVFSLGFAPRRGLVWAWVRLARHRGKVRRENLLADLYRAEEAAAGAGIDRIAAAQGSADRRGLTAAQLGATADRLVSAGLLEPRADGAHGYGFTAAGRTEAARIVRNHRLWELFLARRMDIAPDHVHRDAEDMEHTLPAHVLAELERELDVPAADPHGRPIPTDGRRGNPAPHEGDPGDGRRGNPAPPDGAAGSPLPSDGAARP